MIMITHTNSLSSDYISCIYICIFRLLHIPAAVRAQRSAARAVRLSGIPLSIQIRLVILIRVNCRISIFGWQLTPRNPCVCIYSNFIPLESNGQYNHEQVLNRSLNKVTFNKADSQVSIDFLMFLFYAMMC